VINKPPLKIMKKIKFGFKHLPYNFSQNYIQFGIESGTSIKQSKEQWEKIIISILKIENYQNKLDGHSWSFNNILKRYVSCSAYYHLSKEVEEKIVNKDKLLQQLINSEEYIDIKKYFYGKNKETTLDHMIPTAVIVEELLKLVGKNNIEKKTKEILNNSGTVSIILREENESLNFLGFSKKMPNNWNFKKSYLDRYKFANIKLSKTLVRRGKKEICI
jgi:hypothetical protein